MKVFISSSSILILVILFYSQGGLSSCTKEHTIIETVTVKDTIIIKDTVLTSDILTSHPWKTKELRGVYGDVAIYYLRGGFNNTRSFDLESFTFYPDGNGLSVDGDGYTHEIKEWQFVNTDQTKLTFKYYITNSTIFQFMTWDKIRYIDNSIVTEEYWHDNYVNKNYHGSAVRIP